MTVTEADASPRLARPTYTAARKAGCAAEEGLEAVPACRVQAMAGTHHEAAARVARGEGAQLAVDVLKDHRRPRREQHPRRRVLNWRAAGLVAAALAAIAATLDDCTPQ